MRNIIFIMKLSVKSIFLCYSCAAIILLLVLLNCKDSVTEHFYNFIDDDTISKSKVYHSFYTTDPILCNTNTISKLESSLQKQSRFMEYSLSKTKEDKKKPVNNSVLEEYIHIEYERYVTTIQAKCNSISRCGKGESGYDVCVDTVYKPKQPCLVYSFGSHFSFGFEKDVFKRFKCEIHTFDPSIPLAGHMIPKGVNFHLIGLSDSDDKNELGWEMKTLSSIRTYLNHSYRQLDILKLDIEGYEWKAIPQILASVSSTDIKQLLLEVHFGREMKGTTKNGFMKRKKTHWGLINPYTQLTILKHLKLYGFHIFSYFENDKSRINIVHSIQKSVITCYILSMKNIHIS